MIPITATIAIDEREISESFIRASGPGGQHVNTTATAVELRFDALGSANLPEHLRARLKALAGQRMTREGVIVITVDTHRSQARNRDEALERLVELLRKASIRPAIRKATRPTLGSKLRRLDKKKQRAGVKAGRRGSFDAE